MTGLAPFLWRAKQAAHEARVREWTGPHQSRSERGEKHPVYDFLFTYYSYRPSLLHRWHPGFEFTQEGSEAEEFLRWPSYRQTPEGVAVDRSQLRPHRYESVQHIRDLLIAIQGRPPFYGCFGLHEWAMVYQQSPEEIRHNTYALRFPSNRISTIIEETAICCTHYDAFRFFTEPARPLNRNQLTRKTTAAFEQRGCLHANMDLYKWSAKLSPFASSELVADCFELARDIREIDMRASPYDLSSIGFAPIPIETVEGRMIYERHQREFAARSEPLRAKVISVCNWLLSSD